MVNRLKAWRGIKFIGIAVTLNVLIALVFLLTSGLGSSSTDYSAVPLEQAQLDGAVAVYRVAEEWPDGAVAYGDGTAAGYVTAASWDRTDVSYSLNNCPASIDCGAAHQAFRDAANAWNNVSGLNLYESPGNADINVLWVSEFNFGDDGSRRIDGPNGILGVTYFPLPWLGSLAGDIFFDDAETWVINNPTAGNQIHFPTVAIHEIGHAVGLDHSENFNAVMWAEYVGPRGITDDDVAGIASLYGASGESAQPPAAPSNVTLISSVNLRIRAEPTTRSQQIGTLNAGTQANVVGRNAASDWAYIDNAGQRGWVAAWLTTISGDFNSLPVVNPDGSGAPPPPPDDSGDPPPSPQDPQGVAARTTTTVVLRSGPDTSYSRLGTIPFNTTVPVFGRSADSQWVYVEHNGQRGWSAAFLMDVSGNLDSVPVLNPDGSGGETPPPEQPPAAPSGITARADATIVLRSGPDTTFQRIGSVPFGSVVPVLGRSADSQWLYVDYNGQEGWIAGWLTSIDGNINEVPVR